MKWFGLEIDLKKPEKYHLIIWQLLGLLPPEAPGYKRFLYNTFAITIHFVTTFCCPLTMIICILKAKSFTTFCENVFTACAVVGVSVKFFSTYFVIPKLNLVTEYSGRLLDRTKSEDELQCLKEAMYKGLTVFKRISVTYIFGLIFSIMISFLNAFASEPFLSLPAWYPLDWKNNRILFQFCNFHQAVSLTWQGLEAIVTDTYVLVYIYYFVGHINALSRRVQKIGANSKEINRHESYLELIECIKDHQHAIKIRDFIQSISNVSVFIQFLIASTSQVFGGYYVTLSLSTMSSLEKGRFFAVITCIILQILLPCYHGEKVTTACFELYEAIYNIKWYDQDVRFRRAFLVFLQRVQKDECLMAGNHIPITLQSFMAGQKIVYSFITMLQNSV